MRCFFTLGLVGALLGVATTARAWGHDGHRVVGELAWHQLSTEARASVAECLSDPGYETLAEAATWPDTVARRFREYDAMAPFHYVNVDSKAQSYNAQRDCPNGCVVNVLGQFVTLLGSKEPPLSLKERRFSIYWIAHLVGDIHQPLHVAHPDGKGGTATQVFFPFPGVLGQAAKPNAHWVWDVGLIEQRPAALQSSESAPEIKSEEPSHWRALAASLLADMKPARAKAWQQVTSPEAYANEGLALARRHAFMKSDQVVDAAYVETKWPIVAQQLQKAGARLAGILNRVLSHEPQSP